MTAQAVAEFRNLGHPESGSLIMSFMVNTPEPPVGSPEYQLIGLERIVSSIDKNDEGAHARLSATVTFLGDGDMVQEAEIFQRAADYFRSHPELCVNSANWITFDDPGSDDECYGLEVTVSPPGWLSPDQVPYIYPNAKR